MVHPLTVVTKGYLTPFPIQPLEIAVDGYLIENVPPVPPDKREDDRLKLIMYRKSIKDKFINLKKEDEEILLILNSFVISKNCCNECN